MRIQVCTPTYIEAREHRGVPAGGRGPRCPRPTSSSSTTTAPTAPPTSPSGSAAELGQIEVLRRPEKRGLGNAYRAGFAIGIARGLRGHLPDRRRPLARPRGAPRADRGRRRRRRPRDRLALRARRLDPALAVAPAGDVEVRQHVHRLHAAHRREGRDRGLPRVPGRDAARRRLRRRPAPRATASRSSSRTASPQAGGKIVEVPITFTDRVRGYSKMSMAVMVEEMALVSWWGIRDRLERRRSD